MNDHLLTFTHISNILSETVLVAHFFTATLDMYGHLVHLWLQMYLGGHPPLELLDRGVAYVYIIKRYGQVASEKLWLKVL